MRILYRHKLLTGIKMPNEQAIDERLRRIVNDPTDSYSHMDRYLAKSILDLRKRISALEKQYSSESASTSHR